MSDFQASFSFFWIFLIQANPLFTNKGWHGLIKLFININFMNDFLKSALKAFLFNVCVPGIYPDRLWGMILLENSHSNKHQRSFNVSMFANFATICLQLKTFKKNLNNLVKKSTRFLPTRLCNWVNSMHLAVWFHLYFLLENHLSQLMEHISMYQMWLGCFNLTAILSWG